MTCGACGMPELVPDDPTQQHSTWSCRLCSSTETGSGGIFEDEVALADDVIKLNLRSTADFASLVQLYNKCRERLGRMHWTVAKCSYLLAIASASHPDGKDVVCCWEFYCQFREFARHIMLEQQVPTVYHVLT